MPTRKDKTNVAPIHREQIFIPASGATLLKQQARPKVAGRPVSSGAIEIVSPEFDLLTGVRGLLNMSKPNKVYANIGNGSNTTMFDGATTTSEAVKQGIKEARYYVRHPVIVETVERNKELAERISGKPARNMGWFTDGNRVPANTRAEVLQHYIDRPVHIQTSNDLPKGFLGDYTSANTRIRVKSGLSPYDTKRVTFHEGLHHSGYGNFEGGLYDLKAEKLFGIDDYLLGHEAAVNTAELGRMMGLELGQKYPGFQTFKDMIAKYNVDGFDKKFIFDKAILNTPRDYKRFWDALTGKYFTTAGAAVTGLNLTNTDKMKCGGRRKAQLGLDIREGGIAIPIANNMFYINGRKHAVGGVAIGPNNKNGVEVEGGEVVEMIDSNHPSIGRQFKAGGQQQTMRVFSSVPFLRGVSPAQLVMEGANPDTVFKAQEEFKDKNRINDDGTTYQNGGQKKSNSAIRTEADKKVPAYNRAIYSLVDPTMGYPTKKEAFGYAIGAGIKAMRNPNDMVYWVTDSVSDAAWRKRHGLSYDNKFLIPNEDGSVRLPKDREMEIPTDTTMLKNRIAANEKLAKRYPEGSEKRDIVDWALKVDGMALDSLRHTYRTGEPVTINEGAYNSRRLINNGELSYPEIMPHNVMQNYAIQYDKSKDKMNYWDTYNFNQFEWGVPGKPFEIKGSIPLKKAGGIYIKPSKRGTFTAAATKHGMGVQEFASKVLNNKDDYSPAMVKKANFARNASRWKKEYGGDKNVLPELIVTPRSGYNKIYDASGINKRKKIAQDILQILPFSGFVNDVLGFTNPINAGGAVKSVMGYGAAKAGLPFLSIPGIAFNGALGLPDLIQDVQTLYKDVKTPKEEFNKNKKEFGGSMIYTINGNVKNGLNLRPKAQYGLATKYLKKKNKTTEKPVGNKKKDEPKVLDIRNTTGYKIKQAVENPWVKYPVEVASYLLSGATAKGMNLIGTVGKKAAKEVVNKTDDVVFKFGKTRKNKEDIILNTVDEIGISNRFTKPVETTISYKPQTRFRDGKTYVVKEKTIKKVAEKRFTPKKEVIDKNITTYTSPKNNTGNTINFEDAIIVRKQMDPKTSRELDKVYRKAVGNKEPKSGFGRVPQQTTIEYTPKGESVTAYDASVEFHKRISDMLYNNLVKKYGKKGVDKAMKAERISKYEYGGRIKAKNGKFLKYKNGVFTDPETGEQFDVDPEVFNMYGNTKESGVIPISDYTKGTFNARPQYYAEKRLPIAGSQSIAEKAGLARSGWSYGENPTFDYVPNINISVPTNYAKAVGDNSKKSTSSTPRGEGTKSSKATTKSIEYPSVVRRDEYYSSNEPKGNSTPVDESYAARQSRGIQAVNEQSPSSTGGGTQSKDGRWVGQYKTTNVGDWIGLGSNLAGTIASYFMTKNAINKMPEPLKPVMTPAVKLKTKYNIQPQLTNISEAEQLNRATVRRNTQSSNTSLAREQRLMNEARGARNTLYGQKENIETQLINQDRLNRQSVMRDNVRAYNEYLNKVTATKMAQNEMRASNINNLISGLTGSVNSILGNIESRRVTNNTLRAIAAANPNVDARLIGGFDYYIDPITKKKYNKNQQYVGTING